MSNDVLSYREFDELTMSEKVAYFRDLDEEDRHEEYIRLIRQSDNVKDYELHEAFGEARVPEPEEPEYREHTPEERKQFLAELEAAPDIAAGNAVLHKYGRLANPEQHGFAS